MTRAPRLLPRFAVLLVVAIAAGCASAPDTAPEQDQLEAAAEAALAHMTERDPSLRLVVDRAIGYVVFPKVGAGGFIFGGAGGVGVLYEGGVATGYVEMRKGTVGAQIGGKSFSELIVFLRSDPLDRLKGGTFELRADATATAVRAGAAAAASSDRDTAVFIAQQEGMMAEAAVGGQSLHFRPRE